MLPKAPAEPVGKSDACTPELLPPALTAAVPVVNLVSVIEAIFEPLFATTVSSADLVLSAPGTGSVVVDDQLHILTTPSSDDASIDPSAPTDGAKLYVKAPGVGKTGIYYVNSSNVNDELVSKNRSLLLSMIF